MRESEAPEPAEDSEAESKDPLTKPHNVRWPLDAWERIERAAAIHAERELIRFTPTDLIRQATIRRADEILAEAAVGQ